MRWDKDFALSILSNIADIAYNNPKALKTLAYKYEELNKPQDAMIIYKRIAILQGKDAQSYRDLAHIYTQTGNYKEAMQLYKQMLSNKIEGVDFTGLQKTIESEIKHLTTVHRDKINFKGLPDKYLEANFKYNTRIVFEWNDPYAEFELQFVNPKMKYFSWSHTKNNNYERILGEITNGYFTEEYIIDDENSGEWIINIQSFKEGETANPDYLKYTVYQHYGLENETKTIRVIKLSEYQQKVTLDEFVSAKEKIKSYR
jgi:pentatricopeptide repeat protein